VLVIDTGQPRNAPAAHAHNYLSRDGAAPSGLLASGRAEVTGYGGRIISGGVISAARLDSQDDRDGFRTGVGNDDENENENEEKDDGRATARRRRGKHV